MPAAATAARGIAADADPLPQGRPVLRIGIVGCGKIADGHVEQVRALGRGEVVAACDREQLMAEQLATRLHVPRHYADLAQMLDHERLDVVHVATPPDAHPGIAAAAFAAGCHVFMEKPFALTADQAGAILEQAGRAGRRVSVNYLYNFEAPALELQQLVAAGALGEFPLICLSSALSYFDSYRQGRGTSNLIQAQRDFFGAHGFERIDAPGAHHGPWGGGQ